MVSIDLFISKPVAWFAMHKWFTDFDYRADLSWWMFAVAGLLILFIALATTRVQSVKPSFANPVKSSRTE